MGHKHSRESILEAALEAALDKGLSQLTYGRLAARLGIPDRTIVYYFPTKEDLVTSVLILMGQRLRTALDSAGPLAPRNHRELARAAWPVLTLPGINELFALFLEVNGLASAGREPYRSLVSRFVGTWIDWAASLFPGSPEDNRSEAAASIALLDGLALVRHIAGPEVADLAAQRLLAE